MENKEIAMWVGAGFVVLGLISFIIYYNFIRSGLSDWVDDSECKNGLKTQKRTCERAGDCTGDLTRIVTCSSSNIAQQDPCSSVAWEKSPCDVNTGIQRSEKTCPDGSKQVSTGPCDVDCLFTILSNNCPQVCGTGDIVYRVTNWAKNNGVRCPTGVVSASEPNIIRKSCNKPACGSWNPILPPNCPPEGGIIPLVYECDGLCDQSQRPSGVHNCNANANSNWGFSTVCTPLANDPTKGNYLPVCNGCPDGTTDCCPEQTKPEPQKCSPKNLFGGGTPWTLNGKNNIEQCVTSGPDKGTRSYKQICKPDAQDGYGPSVCDISMRTLIEPCAVNGEWGTQVCSPLCDGVRTFTTCERSCTGAVNGGICVNPTGVAGSVWSYTGFCPYWDQRPGSYSVSLCQIYGKGTGYTECMPPADSPAATGACPRNDSVSQKFVSCTPAGVWDGVYKPKNPAYTDSGHPDICKCQCTGPNDTSCTNVNCNYDATQTCLPAIPAAYQTRWNTIRSLPFNTYSRISQNWVCPTTFATSPPTEEQRTAATRLNNIIEHQKTMNPPPTEYSGVETVT